MSSGDEAGAGGGQSSLSMIPRERCRVYVGNLPEDIRPDELVEGLGQYGQVKDADIKFGRTRNGTAYAFIEYVTPESAERAVNEGDGSHLFGVTLKVEFTGVRKNKSRSYNNNEPSYVGSGPPQRSEYRVIVSGLPRHTSWQDLKDHMRGAGPVGYAHVDEDGIGTVEYTDRRGVDRALTKLHRSMIETHLRRSAKIDVYLPEDFPNYHHRGGRGSAGRGRSPSPYRSRGGYDNYNRRRGGSLSRSPSPRGPRRRDDDMPSRSRHLSPPSRRSISPRMGGGRNSGAGRRSLSPRRASPPPMRRSSVSIGRDSRDMGPRSLRRDDSLEPSGAKRSRGSVDLDDSVKRRRRRSFDEEDDALPPPAGGSNGGGLLPSSSSLRD